jgi:hypothetical protein
MSDEKKQAKPRPPEGCWLAYDSGFNRAAVFSSEVQALRYAVVNGLRIERVSYGVDLREAVKASNSNSTPRTERTT